MYFSVNLYQCKNLVSLVDRIHVPMTFSEIVILKGAMFDDLLQSSSIPSTI